MKAGFRTRGIMNGRGRKGRYKEIVEAEWRPVRPPWTRGELITAFLLSILFIGSGIFLFFISGLPTWWELHRHGEEARAHVIDLEAVIGPGRASTSVDYDRLTVTFHDDQNRYQKVIITEPGRFAIDHGIDRFFPRSLPKEVSIVYSRRNPQIAELRDYRLHGWWMAVFSLLVAAMCPGFLYLGQREKKRTLRDASFTRRREENEENVIRPNWTDVPVAAYFLRRRWKRNSVHSRRETYPSISTL